MNRLRKLVAISMSIWLLLCGSAAYALVALEAEHEHEHVVVGHKAHDARDHAHPDSGIELYSQLFGLTGLDQLTSGWIAPGALLMAQSFSGIAPLSLAVDTFCLTPIPPPGPPPRAVPLNRGGRLSA